MMKAKETLLHKLDSPASRMLIDEITALVLQNKEMFPLLMEIMLEHPGRAGRNAAWAAEFVTEQHPEWLEPYVAQLIEKLPHFPHTSFERQATKMLSKREIAEEYQGILFDHCARFFMGDKPTAVKMFSMLVMYNISEKEKELKPELIEMIDSRLEFGSSGLQNISKKMLRKLRKECGRSTARAF